MRSRRLIPKVPNTPRQEAAMPPKQNNKSPDSERGKNEDYIQVRHGPHFAALAEAEHPQPASADWKNHAQSGHFRRKTRLRRLLLRRGIEVRMTGWLPRNEMPKQPEPEA